MTTYSVIAMPDNINYDQYYIIPASNGKFDYVNYNVSTKPINDKPMTKKAILEKLRETYGFVLCTKDD